MHRHYVKAHPFGMSSSGWGCLLSGGHAVVRCSGFTLGREASADGYQDISTAPEDTLLHVCWGELPRRTYGVAKRAMGTWWLYGQANPHACRRECASPTGWCGEYK